MHCSWWLGGIACAPTVRKHSRDSTATAVSAACSQLRCFISVGHGAAPYRGSPSLFLFWRPVNARLSFTIYRRYRIHQLCDLTRCCLFSTATEQGCTCQDFNEMQNSRHFTADTTMFHMVRDYFIEIRSDCTSSVTTRTSCLQQRRLAGAPARVKTRCF